MMMTCIWEVSKRSIDVKSIAYPAVTPILATEKGPQVVVFTAFNTDGLQIFVNIFADLGRFDEQDRLRE